MNWGKVARYLDNEAKRKQDEANSFVKEPTIARMKDETASLLRSLASAIRAGST